MLRRFDNTVKKNLTISQGERRFRIYANLKKSQKDFPNRTAVFTGRTTLVDRLKGIVKCRHKQPPRLVARHVHIEEDIAYIAGSGGELVSSCASMNYTLSRVQLIEAQTRATGAGGCRCLKTVA